MAVTSPFHNKVSLRGYYFEDSIFTFNLKTGITQADIGKAVSLDTSAANTVKLAGDGDVIIGRLETVENRTVEGTLVGAVALRFAELLPIKSGETVAVGDTVVGAGNGEVKALKSGEPAASAPNYAMNFVAEVIGTNAVVVKAS